MKAKVAIVTGANKGIGFAIVKGLCERFDGDVYLTARDPVKGKDAVARLRRMGLNPLFLKLDITDPESIFHFYEFILERYGGIDILINNAAFNGKNDSKTDFEALASKIMYVNYFSLVLLCDVLLPALKPQARVVNLVCANSHLSQIFSTTLRNKFASQTLTESELSDLSRKFVNATRNKTHIEDGWGEDAYSISKVAVAALTFIQDRIHGPRGISVNCVHPGFVNTDSNENLSPDEGAVAPLYLALDAPQDLKGVYMWHDKSIVNWFGELEFSTRNIHI